MKICPGCKKNKNLWDAICDVLSIHIGLWKLCHSCRSKVIYIARYHAQEAFLNYKRKHMKQIVAWVDEQKKKD